MLFRKATQISVARMIELEKELDNSVLHQYNSATTCSDLAKAFQLKVCYVAKEELGKDVEAELTTVDDNDYYGLIRIDKELRANPFAFMHEIMHYVFDVECGKRVTKTYTRKIRGVQKDAREQEIDYLTAAQCMPKEKIKLEIQRYDTASPRLNADSFVYELAQRYSQSKQSVVRRIQEVRKITSAAA